MLTIRLQSCSNNEVSPLDINNTNNKELSSQNKTNTLDIFTLIDLRTTRKKKD